MKVCIFLVTLFAIAKCIYAGDDAVLTPISTTGLESDPKRENLILPRIKRQVYHLDYPPTPQRLQPREQTVIVVPESGGNGYRGAANSPYGANNNFPNRGTRVVITQ